MKSVLLLFTSMLCLFGYTQNQLQVYAAPPAGEITRDDASNNIFVPLAPPLSGKNDIPANYTVQQNNDFTVKVSSADFSADNDGNSLFAYTTFTNRGYMDERSKASYVSFGFSGTAYIEVTCNFSSNINFEDTGILLIRPQSKGISPYYKKGNVFRFAVSSTGQFCVEVNGQRDRNLQIFANPINNYTPLGSNVIIYKSGIHTLKTPPNNNPDGNKIYIKSGAIVIGSIEAHDNDEIYIEGGGILKGEITVMNKTNVKIHGHGSIDLTNFKKKYTADEDDSYQYNNGIEIHNSSNIFISGITVNDPQLKGLLIVDSEGITIENFKAFTRVLWGDGIYMTGTSNVTIANCYLRTADDCISIYASRRETYNGAPSYKNRNAQNITVTNTSLYADNSHPVEIGWHGNQEKDNKGNAAQGRNIYNIRFDSIDILEHFEKWIEPNNEHPEYMGAISINCADGNNCSNMWFTNINVEDFTRGRLLSVNVEPAGYGAAVTDGKSVSAIHFENLFYNGSGEKPSSIKGVSRKRMVQGVHFKNFRVNGKTITKISDYSEDGKSMIETNRFAKNVSFE